jgi:transposase
MEPGSILRYADKFILLFNKTLQKLKLLWYNVYGDETMSYTFTAQDLEIIREARNKNKDKRAEVRLHTLQLRAEGMRSKDIAAKVGVSAPYVSQLAAKYFAGGIEAIAGNHYGGNRRNMSYEEEELILKPFYETAEKGKMVEISEIEEAYQEKVEHRIGNVQIYRVLHRHGWRKIMPRSKHPKKASEEAINASKKLSGL